MMGSCGSQYIWRVARFWGSPSEKFEFPEVTDGKATKLNLLRNANIKFKP